MRARVELNRAGLLRVLRGTAVSEGTKRAAEAVAERARSLARVDTGTYRDSISVERIERRDRTGHQVAATDGKALFIEFGARGRTGLRVLGRAAETRG